MNKSKTTGFEFMFRTTAEEVKEREDAHGTPFKFPRRTDRDGEYINVWLWVPRATFVVACGYAADYARSTLVEFYGDFWRLDQDAMHVVKGVRVEDVAIRDNVPENHPILEWAD